MIGSCIFFLLLCSVLRQVGGDIEWTLSNVDNRTKIIESLVQKHRDVIQELRPSLLLKRLPFRNYDSFLNNESFVACLNDCGPSQWGNRIAFYFETAACADIARHHFVYIFDHPPEDKFYHGFQKVFIHPDPLTSGDVAAELFRRSCPQLTPFPFVQPGAWNRRPLLISRLMNKALEHAYPTANTDHWYYNTFDFVNNHTILDNNALPAIPDAVILFRCRDVLTHDHTRPYGFVNFNFYKKVLPVKVKTIYILSEPLTYRGASAEDVRAQICVNLIMEKVKFLQHQFPNTLIGIRRGYAYDSLLMLARAKNVVCAPSTFCLWPGIANPNHVYFIPGNVIHFNPFLSESFYWVAYPPTIHLGDFHWDRNHVGAYKTLLNILTAPINSTLIDYRHSYVDSISK
jgi:hypothetical protein